MKKPVQILLLSGFLLTFIVTKQLNVMQDTQEIWKDVVGYEGYYKVSNFGNVYSIVTQKVLKPTIQKKNVCRVKLYKQHESMCYCVHRLVGIAFIPNPENKPQINHIDANRLNNNLSNLEWVTHQENIDHAERLCLVPRMIGTRNGNSKVTPEQVHQIRSLRSSVSARKLAKMYGVTRGCINGICKNKTWLHI